MDLPSKNMYDTFRDEIWKELGPLDPNWFEILTTQTSANEENVSDQDDLCANQEGNFKAPLDKTAVDSQLFSTPKVFRHSRIVSPETEDEQLFTAEQVKGTLPWTATKSPSLFQTSKQGVPGDRNGEIQPQTQDSFDLLHTPHKSPVCYAKHISESLGAQINPDISWTSSFNTPPAVPSTLILSKTDESLCPGSVLADKDVVFVRKLFPSLSNASADGATPPKNNDMTAVNQGAVSPEAESHDSPQTSLNQSDGAWQQKLPDAIEDGQVRSTISGVLDGAENVLSIFFANSSSALRKVKPGKIKRKQIIQTKEHDCCSAKISTTNNAASTEEGTTDQEPGRSPSSLPVKTGDTGISQWSPLNLSEIPPCTVENSVLTEHRQSDSDFCQLVRAPMNITDSGFIRKKRKFVYTVGTLKPQVQGKETQSQKVDSSPGIPDLGPEVSVKQLENAPDEADCCSKTAMQKQAMLNEENLPPSVQAKVQDVDMSQLCRDFAQDFSQMSDSGKLSKAAEDTRSNFSPWACLSAMKQAKQKPRPLILPHEGNGVSDRRQVSTTNQNDSINGATVSDSGFQSAVGDITHTTASSFVLPCSENAGHSRQSSGFKADIYRTIPFPSTNKENGNVHLLAEAETKMSSDQRSQLKERQMLHSGRETGLHIESTPTELPSSVKGTVDTIDCFPLNGHIRGRLPEKTAVSLPSVCASGFKTASNKGIRISSANLERAKHLFEETQGERAFSDQPTKCDHATKRKVRTSNGSVKSSTSNSDQLPSVSERFEDTSCQLTASQKADVTELCTLLEETDSQFEFTQFKPTKSKQRCQDDTTSPQKAYKEIDPDFLMGIDFDDSFSSDADKLLANPAMPEKMTTGLNDETNSRTSNATSRSTGMSSSSARESSSDGSSCLMSTESKNLHRAEHTETSKLEKKNPVMLGVAFQTAGGNVLRVSKTCLSKARALFADLEENLAHRKSPDKENSEMDAETQKKPSVDCNTGEDKLKIPFKNIHHVGEGRQGCFSNTKEPVCSDKRITRDEDATKSFKSSEMDTTLFQSGFHMASGKGISVSAKYMQQADAFFRDCDIMGRKDGMSVKDKRSIEPVAESAHNITNLQGQQGNIAEEHVSGCSKFDNVNAGLVAHPTKEPHPDDIEMGNIGFNSALALKKAVSYHGKAFSTSKPVSSPLCTTSKNVASAAIDELSRCDGFFTAGGKKVSVSADALKRAECLLNEIHTLEDTNKQLNQKENASRMGQLPAQIQVSSPKNGGFQTASGKGVSISSAALKKAKSLLSEYEEVEHKIGVNPLQSKVPVHGPPPRNGGFLAASGKQLAFSSEALQKAKTLFSDISCSAETPAVSPTRNTDKKEDNAANIEKMNCGFTTAGGKTDTLPPENGGFQTASGKRVAISSEALKKAKSVLSECDEVVDKTSVKPLHSRIPVQVPPPRNGGFLAASGKPVALSSEALQKAKALFSDISFSVEIPDVSHTRNTDKKQDNAANAERTHCGFTTAGGGKVLVSQNNLLKAKHLLTEFDDFVSTEAMQEADAFFKDCNMDCNGGMSVKQKKCIPPVGGSGSEKNISELKPDQRVTVTIPQEPGNGCTEFASKQVKQKEDTAPAKNGGFQTASGKGVAISSEALKKAKSLFSECEGVTPTHPKIPVPSPSFRRTGFLAASGKPVGLSSEALQKAKALFSDIGLSTDIPAVSDKRTSGEKRKDAQNNTEKIACGFTTAGGAKVHLSEKSLLNANNILKEFADGECRDSHSYSTSPNDTHNLDLSTVRDVKRTSNFSLATASIKDMPAKGSASSALKSFQSLQETHHVNEAIESSSVHGCSYIKDKAPRDAFQLQEDSPGQEMPGVSDSELNQTSSSKASKVTRPGESSVLNFQSLNLTGCTETQQKFLAQEALDCTKALLEDEDLAGQSLSMTVENMPLKANPKSSNRAAEEDKGRGKRSVEDADMTGQPPLKRRLLEEFDRTVDGPRGSTLHPVNSCPNGVTKDRGVFKYSVSLRPNITRPHSNGKTYVEARFQKATPTQHSTPRDSRLAHKMPAFVPPFIKNAKTETRKNTVLKDNIRAPPAFVPPFKKQNTVVQESSSKPQVEADRHRSLFAMPSNSNTCVPPSKKTQGASDVTVSVDTKSNNMMDNESLPVACGSEASAVDETFSRSQDTYQNLQNIELARDMQDMRIRKKKRQTIRPLPGSLFLTKTSGVARIPLKVAVNDKTPARYTQKQLYGFGVHKHVSEITGETAESFRFNLLHFIKQEAFTDGGGVQLADGGWLIPANDGTAGKEEFYRALCDSPGVDPKLISEAWVYNHYRWVVWKQTSMEKSFPETMGSLCLTPEQVLLQLKYRYDVEVDHSCRPALRKIMEKDDTAAKTLILCVSEIVSRGHSPNRQSRNYTKTPQDAAKVETPSAIAWLTDGWYAIKAQLDEPLTAMLHKGRLAVGGKLIIHGAQLVGSQDACSPLEAPESLMLKICANSSRPARWDAKLGFHRDPRPFLLPVSSLYSNGGPVGCVDIVILRSYPIQWMERKPDGSVVFRSVRAEEKEARRFNSHRQKVMETLFAKIQADFEKEEKGNVKPQRRRQTLSHQDIASLQDGEELYEAVGDDPAYLEAHLSEQQMETLHTYRRTLMEKKQAELQDRYRRALEAEDNETGCPKRDVTPVWRLCIADSADQPGNVYQLNLWRPSSDLQSLLKEGCRYKVYHLTTSDGKKRSCIESVQLTGTKKTQFQELQASHQWFSARFQPRVSTNFVKLQNPEFQPLCGEVDLSGYVVSIIDEQGSSPALFLVNEKLDFVKVRCFSSLSQSGLEDVVKPRVLLALSNLQLRGQSMYPTPVVYAGDLTVFSTNPKEVHLQESLHQLKNLVQCQENFFLSAEEKLSHLIESDGLSSISSPALQLQTPASTTDRRQDAKTSVISQKPIRSLGSFTPINRDPPAATSSTEKDPKSLKRRKALDYLSRVPSPPPLFHLGSVASPCVNKTFKTPRRSSRPSTLKTVQTPAHKPTDSLGQDEWVNDEELAMIDTQALRSGDLL